MKLAEYIAKRAALAPKPPRDVCSRCCKARPTCYCHKLRPFQSPIDFVILHHSQEARNAIATARMAHLSITNSMLLRGRAFEHHAAVNALINDPTRRNIMLYPSQTAVPLEELWTLPSPDPTAPPSPPDPRPWTFWVLDAKWSQVPKMLRLSPNVRALPMAKFTPDRQSVFRVRQQPHPSYLSTIESIYLVIDRYLRHHGLTSTDHQALLDVFDHLVEQQLGYINYFDDTRHAAAKGKRRAHRAAKQLSPA